MFDAAGPAPPDISWTLDGAAVDAVPIRTLTRVHTGSRTFTGVYSLTNPGAAGVPHRITARAKGSDSPAQLVVRPVPDLIPADDWLRILLISCFHQDEDRGGRAARTVRNIRAAERPDLTLLMGDQVYLDLPTLKNFPDKEAELGVL